MQGRGPRYCPSIEDKVVRFADKERHQIFLEPEGRNTLEYYCNGISTSLPKDVQQAMLRLIPGLENAEIMRWGYAVEYDYAPPTQLHPTLETKPVEGLYFAGPDQRHHRLRGSRRPGTDGRHQRRPSRSRASRRWCWTAVQAYIGVLIDDLVTKGVDEPYRMFTSPGRISPAAAARQRRPPADAARPARGLVDDAAWDRLQEQGAGDRRSYRVSASRGMSSDTLEQLAATHGDRLAASCAK